MNRQLASTGEHLRLQLIGKQPALMILCLRDRRFEELDRPSEIDGSGNFIITSDRPEWREWLADITAAEACKA